MNWLDWVILVYLGLAAWQGWRKGLARMVLPLVGLLTGLLLASRYYPYLAERLPGLLGAEAKVAAFVIIVAAVVVAAFLLAELLAHLLTLTMLGWADRLGGVGLGLILGALTVAAALALWAKYPLIAGEGVLQGSALAPWFQDSFSTLLSLLPFHSRWDSVRTFFQ